MVHSMPLKNVSGQSYKATIRTFGSSLVFFFFVQIMPIGPQIVPPLGSHVLHMPWVGLQSVILVFPGHTHCIF